MNGMVSELIAASPERVAEVMFDFSWEPYWIPAVKSVERASDHSEFVAGMRIRRKGNIFGPREWTIEVGAHDPSRLLLRHVDGDLKGSEEVYELAREGLGTRAAVRYSNVALGFPEGMLFRWAYRKNLKRLKVIVEQREVRRLSKLSEAEDSLN